MKKTTNVIDGKTYHTVPMPASQGLVILPKLVDLVGETGIALLMQTSDEEKDSLLEDNEVTAALISGIAKRAAKNGGLLVLKDLLEETVCDHIAIGDNMVSAKLAEHFDEHFAGQYQHLISVAIWVGRVSFGTP